MAPAAYARTAVRQAGNRSFIVKTANVYITLHTKDQERAQRRATVAKLHLERLSQCAIAPTTGVSRNMLASIVKKALTPIAYTIGPVVDDPSNSMNSGPSSVEKMITLNL